MNEIKFTEKIREKARSNFCVCQNCGGGYPIILAKEEERLYNMGLFMNPAHQKGRTLFLTKDSKEKMEKFRGWLPNEVVGAWILGDHRKEK